MKTITTIFLVALLLGIASAGFWDPEPVVTKSQSGLVMQIVNLAPVKDGMSLEQYNIAYRYNHDNKPDALKYVYVLGENGQVCLHYTIIGKVTSSGKRLTPRTVAAGPDGSGYGIIGGMDVTIAGKVYQTTEVIEDDGTYGDSSEYFYMITTAGNYIQVVPMGSFLMLVADKQLTPTELTYTFTKE